MVDRAHCHILLIAQFSGNLEEELRSELKALLENKNLAEEELKEAEEE